MLRLLKILSNALAPLTLFAALAAYLYPPLFDPVRDWYLWLFALTMLALGLVLRPAEFMDEFRQPKRLLLGLCSQFSVMPLLGFAVAWSGGWDESVALGFVIVGCAPGAMASNVIVYLSGGAVAYSVALTTAATILAPLLTPALTEILGGVFLPVPFWAMARTITVTVVGPLVLGMLFRRLARGAGRIAEHVAPAAAVICIVLIIGVAVSSNADEIAQAGGWIFLAVVVVNAMGYLVGWTLAGVYGFDRGHRLALTIEIGMQNAGLGVALALRHFDPETALPGVWFAVWCILTAAGMTSFLRYSSYRRQCKQ